MTRPRTILIVTGSRAEFGLLRPVMTAVAAHRDLDLRVLVTGTHLLPPARTADEVEAAFDVATTVEMQRPGETGRLADAAALGRGVSGIAAHLAGAAPDVVLVLGDRIEALATAAAAAVAGIRVAHMHGGDRGEGIADESMRHAITKLAHIHLPATVRSTERIIAMGEVPLTVHLVGSPAIDGLDEIGPLDDGTFDALGRPEILLLLHPTGRDASIEAEKARDLIARCTTAGRVVALHPNHDPGREGVLRALEESREIVCCEHLERTQFIGLLRRVKLIVGNSSAGLIECAAIPRRCIDVGSRQAGREKPRHVISCPSGVGYRVDQALTRGLTEPIPAFRHPYGDGTAGRRTAEILAVFESDKHPVAKRNSF